MMNQAFRHEMSHQNYPLSGVQYQETNYARLSFDDNRVSDKFLKTSAKFIVFFAQLFWCFERTKKEGGNGE